MMATQGLALVPARLSADLVPFLEVCHTWIASIERPPALKLFFGRQSAVADNIEHVQQFQKLQEQLLHKYRGIEAYLRTNCSDNIDMYYSLITVRYGIHRCQALLAWCEETIDRLHTFSEMKGIGSKS